MNWHRNRHRSLDFCSPCRYYLLLGAPKSVARGASALHIRLWIPVDSDVLMDVCGVKSLWSEYSALMSDDRVLMAFSSHDVVSLIAL